jgi:hypothetical protein
MCCALGVETGLLLCRAEFAHRMLGSIIYKPPGCTSECIELGGKKHLQKVPLDFKVNP